VFTTSGQPLRKEPIHSGRDPSLISDLSLSRNDQLAESMLSHVEAHVAAAMRRPPKPANADPDTAKGVLYGDLPDQVVLVINNLVCKGRFSCTQLVRGTLLPDQRLFVYERDKDGRLRSQPVVLIGTGERIKR